MTAWHNVTGHHTETLDYLDSQSSAAPNNIIVAFKNVGFNGFYTAMTMRLHLYDQDKALFYIHPENWPRVDVVAIPFDPFGDHVIVFYDDNIRKEMLINFTGPGCAVPVKTIQDYLAPSNSIVKWWEFVSVTDEVFILGYPHNITDYHYNPVWKRATIATDPKKTGMRKENFLLTVRPVVACQEHRYFITDQMEM